MSVLATSIKEPASQIGHSKTRTGLCDAIVSSTSTPAPSPHTESAVPGADSYAPYGQLIKMLLPRAGSILLYAAQGDLLWCSDGCERLDLRELRDSLIQAGHGVPPSHGIVRTTSAGTRAFIFSLTSAAHDRLGDLIVEMPSDGGRSTENSMIASLLRPVLECLRGRLDLEQTAIDQADEPGDDLDLLVRLDLAVGGDTDQLDRLLRQCVQHFESTLGALAVPERDLLLCADARDPSLAGLSRDHKHLLAWAQLHDRPMLVNRASASPSELPGHKLLSCPVRDAHERVVGVLALFRDAGAADFELRDTRMLELMSRKAASILLDQFDTLTGLMSRRIFERRAQTLLDELAPPAMDSLLYVDIDGLQLINEGFGFTAGDEVLQRAAALIRSELTGAMLATRLGGDRFAVLLPQHGLAQALSWAARLQEALARLSYLQEGRALPVSASLGIASCAPRETLAHALARAELACKQAKTRGRNEVGVYEEAGHAARQQRHALARASLLDALRENRLQLDAQPIQSLYAAGEDFGWEVLLRIRDSRGQILAPQKFIAAAERYRLTPALDRWVFATALELLPSYPACCAGPAQLSFNVSAQSLEAEHFAEFLLDRIKMSGLRPELFCFELRESAAASMLDRAEAFCQRLTAAGARVALDGFGGGLTSIAHLRRLPVSLLKIDGGLVRRMLEDRLVESLVVAAVQAARALEMQTVAEHVESEPVRLKLASLGVDYCQGFAIGAPRPLAEVLGSGAESRVLAQRG